MKIFWNRFLALIFAIIALVLFLKNRAAMGEFLSQTGRIGPGHSPDEITAGLIALGLVGVLIVAIVKILTHDRK